MSHVSLYNAPGVNREHQVYRSRDYTCVPTLRKTLVVGNREGERETSASIPIAAASWTRFPSSIRGGHSGHGAVAGK